MSSIVPEESGRGSGSQVPQGQEPAPRRGSFGPLLWLLLPLLAIIAYGFFSR